MIGSVLVLGGTGFVGRGLCDALVERSGAGGAPLVVASRQPERAKYLLPLPTLRVVQADVHDEATLRRLVRGHDAVVNLVAILHGSPAAFEHVHAELPRKLVRACNDAGVTRVVHVSALGAAPDGPSHYLRTKGLGEAVIAHSGLAFSVLRPSVIFGAHDRFMNLFASLQAKLPVVPLAGAQARFQPVWVQDVAQAIVRCLDDRTTVGTTYECAGPQTYTLAQLVRAAGRWSGHERAVLSLPQALGRLQALAMEWLPGPTLMSRDNLDSMRAPNVAGAVLPGLTALGITPATLDSIVPQYLAPGQGLARFDPWRARHGG